MVTRESVSCNGSCLTRSFSTCSCLISQAKQTGKNLWECQGLSLPPSLSNLQLPKITSLSDLINEIRLREDPRWKFSPDLHRPRWNLWPFQACPACSCRRSTSPPGGRESKQKAGPSSAWTSVKPLFLHKHAPLYLLQCGNSSPALGEGLGPERPIKADTHGKPAERASGEARGAHRAFGGPFTIRIQRTLSWKHSETEVPWSAEVLMMLCKGGI